MKVRLKRPVKLEGKLYTLGVHDIPDGVADHWFFKALVKSHDALVLEEPAPTPAPAVIEEPKPEAVEAESKEPAKKKKR